MTDKVEISVEATECLKTKMMGVNIGSNYISITDVLKTIDSMTEKPGELKWGVGNKKFRWDGNSITGQHEPEDGVVIFDIDPSGRIYKIATLSITRWVSESSLSEIVPVVGMPDIPTIVCLCGSTRFSDAFRQANLNETLIGNIVLSIGCDFKSDDAIGLDDDAKVRLDELHKRKIDLSNEVLIINVDGYIGESTQSELDYAKKLGKKIRYLEPAEEPLKVGDDIIGIEYNAHEEKLYRIETSGECIDFPAGFSVRDCITGEGLRMHKDSIVRLATHDDWIVEIDGVKWRAIWGQYSSGGNSPYYERLTVSYKTEGRCGWYDIGADYNNSEAHNKAMKQLCKKLGIPIKPFKEE